MSNGFPQRHLENSSESGPEPLKKDDTRAFFTSKSDRGLGHAPGHVLAVPQRDHAQLQVQVTRGVYFFHFVVETTNGSMLLWQKSIVEMDNEVFGICGPYFIEEMHGTFKKSQGNPGGKIEE